jgi:hypothetical protein
MPISIGSSDMLDDLDVPGLSTNHQNISRKGRLNTVQSFDSSEGLAESSLRQVHKCFHDSVRIKLKNNLLVSTEKLYDVGNALHERLVSQTLVYDDPGALILDTVPFLTDPGDVLSSSSAGAFSVGDVPLHDWFALTDSFNEAADQIIPSKFMLGEDLVEYDFFKDAIFSIISPRHGIKTLLSLFTHELEHSPRYIRKRLSSYNLGQMTRHLAKKTSNATLFYNFAVRPGISDLQDTFLAHQRVSSRLNTLRSAPGRYLPVRVKQQLAANIVNNDMLPPDTGVLCDYQWQCNYKRSTAIIGAWGRVREDLNMSDTWLAYLEYFGINKMAGLAWELIPYSFVVDWFTNAQERLNSVSRLRVGGPFTQYRGLWASEKAELVEDLYCVPAISPSTDPITYPTGPFVVATRATTSYKRYSSIPDTSGVVDLSALGPIQYLLGASLIVQRLLR